MFNNFVKSMMALCMVTSGWTTNNFESTYRLTQSKIDDFFSNGSKKNDEIKDRTADENSEINTSNSSEGSIGTGEAKTECNGDSIVQSKVIDIIVGSVKGKGYADRDDGKNDEIKDRTADENSEINTSNSSEGSIGPVDEATQTDEEGSVDSSDLNSSNSSGEATETAMRARQANDSCDVRVIDSNKFGASEEDLGTNGVCEKVSNKVLQLNFLTGQYERQGFCTPKEAKAKVIEILKAIQPNLQEVYKYDNKNMTFSNFLSSFNESRHIWEDSEDLAELKGIVVELAKGEDFVCDFNDKQVLEAIWYMMSRRDYGYDY